MRLRDSMFLCEWVSVYLFLCVVGVLLLFFVDNIQRFSFSSENLKRKRYISVKMYINLKGTLSQWQYDTTSHVIMDYTYSVQLFALKQEKNNIRVCLWYVYSDIYNNMFFHLIEFAINLTIFSSSGSFFYDTWIDVDFLSFLVCYISKESLSEQLIMCVYL